MMAEVMMPVPVLAITPVIISSVSVLPVFSVVMSGSVTPLVAPLFIVIFVTWISI